MLRVQRLYPPCAEDGDVDQEDYDDFSNAMGGPNRDFDARFDADHDGDVDLKDFATFQVAFTG